MTTVTPGADRHPIRHISRLRAGLLGAGTLLLALIMGSAFGVGGASAADLQCGGVGNGGGQGIDCHVTVVNNLDLIDPTQNFSTVTVTSCIGASGAVLAGSCIIGPAITTTTLTTEIDQCNGSVNGNGSTVYCTVDVLNQVTGGTSTPVAATVNECNGTGGGGGIVSFACDSFTDPAVAAPSAVTTDPATATVVQCDGSANGGGSVVDCSVDQGSTTNADLVVRVNQCNGSASGGGGVLVCRVGIRNVIRADHTTGYSTAATTTITPPPAPLLAAPVAIAPPVNVVPPITPPAVTPPVVAPPTTGTTGGGSTSSRDRLVNTGSLASTGLASDPQPLALLSVLVVLLGSGIVVAGRRFATRTTR